MPLLLSVQFIDYILIKNNLFFLILCVESNFEKKKKTNKRVFELPFEICTSYVYIPLNTNFYDVTELRVHKFFRKKFYLVYSFFYVENSAEKKEFLWKSTRPANSN